MQTELLRLKVSWINTNSVGNVIRENEEKK